MNKAMSEKTTNHVGKVRVLDSDTDFEEMNAGHIIPNADPPKNEHARGGFGDRDGRNGYGTDSPNGDTALSMNVDSEDPNAHYDGLQLSQQLNSGTSIVALDEDDEDEDDLDLDTDEDFDDDDVDISEIPDDDIDDIDLDDDFDDDADDLDIDDDDDVADDEDRF